MTDYSVSRDKYLRADICKQLSEMLDNPDAHGIYDTSKFMWEMETLCINYRNLDEKKRVLLDSEQIDELKEVRDKLIVFSRSVFQAVEDLDL